MALSDLVFLVFRAWAPTGLEPEFEFIEFEERRAPCKSSWKTLFEPVWTWGVEDDVVDEECCSGEDSAWDVDEEEELETGHLSHLNSFDFKGVCDDSDAGSLDPDGHDGSDVGVDLVLDILAVLFAWSSVVEEFEDVEEVLLFPASLPRLLLNPSMAR
jgi:hypothetical protein